MANQLDKFVSDAMNDCAEADFNPDIVLVALEDCFKEGTSQGWACGFVFGAKVVATGVLGLAAGAGIGAAINKAVVEHFKKSKAGKES